MKLLRHQSVMVPVRQSNLASRRVYGDINYYASPYKQSVVVISTVARENVVGLHTWIDPLPVCWSSSFET